MVDGLCQRYSCPPSVILKEDARTIMQIIQMVSMVKADADDANRAVNLDDISE